MPKFAFYTLIAGSVLCAFIAPKECSAEANTSQKVYRNENSRALHHRNHRRSRPKVMRIVVTPKEPRALSEATFRVRVPRSFPRDTVFRWRFSDGAKRRGRRVRHVFQSSGSFKVRVAALIRRTSRSNERFARRRKTVLVQGPSSGDSDPGKTPTDVYQCENSLQIVDDFSAEPLQHFGDGENVAQIISEGIEPTFVHEGPPASDEAAVLQLNFENAAAPGADDSPLGLDAVCDECPTVEAPGRIGKTAVFDGTTAFVTGAELGRFKFSDSDLTWSMWFKSNSAARQTLIGTYCGFGHLGSDLRLEDGSLRFNVNPAGQPSTTLSSNANSLNDGEWHHVAAVRKAQPGKMLLYVDGVLDNSVDADALGGDITCGRLAVGMYTLGFPAQFGFRGQIDALSLYSRALNGGEIRHLHSGTRSSGFLQSREITLSRPAYTLNALAAETTLSRTKLEVSFDNQHWCALNANGDLDDPDCSFPARHVWYRATLQDDTMLSAVQLDFGCSPSCIDYDNDGYTSIAENLPYCSHAQVDCNDGNAFENPSAESSSCNCSGHRPSQEACNNNVDDDCDGAIDDSDSDCYSGGTIYYISSSIGSDSNTGTSPEAPIYSLQLAQSLLNSAVVPGDKILLRRGDEWHDQTLSIDIQASAAHPVTIGTYGVGERPLLHYTQPVTAINFSAASYVTLQGIHVSRSSKTVNVTGVGFHPQHISTNITLKDLHIDGLAHGLSVYATNFILEDSLINDNENSQSASSHSQGMWVYGGSDFGIVRNNVFSNNGKRAVIFDHNIYLGGGNHWLFEGNDFSGEAGTSIVFHGIQDGNIIRGNVFHDNMNAPAIDISDYTNGQYLQNFVVEQNRIHDNPAAAFWIRGAVNLTVRNNLIYNNGGVFNIADGIDHETDMLAEHNTIFSSGGSSLAAGGTYTFLGNLYCNSVNSGGGILVNSDNFLNPSLGNFSLSAGSIAIDTAPLSPLTTDFYGNHRPIDGDGDTIAVPDYGAVEYLP